MSHLILKKVDVNNIIISENKTYYRLNYKDSFLIKGIPILCDGKSIRTNENYKFYIKESNSEIYDMNNYLKSSIHNYNGFINTDKDGNYLCFTNNYYTTQKLNIDCDYLYLNIKHINKNNHNTIIHII
tara:strand:- start:1426 stop:1809 length:384 start_codon:yes stop_codon:yes gene_type:complete